MRRCKATVFAGFLTGVAALLLAGTAQSAVVYVNAGLSRGRNDGSSWANAFQGRLGLQQALQVASKRRGPTEIWVATGAYAPGPMNAGVNVSFTLINDTTILGGFAGGERSSDERDPVNNVVILTGDLNDDDGEAFQTLFDNVNHVVRADGANVSAILDGVTIEAGRADGAAFFVDEVGAGAMLTNSSATISHCTFQGNYAQHGGGGIAIVGGSPTILDCEFKGCHASHCGGGIYHGGSATALIENCQFTGNLASLGPGIYNLVSAPVVRGCDFVANGAKNLPGAGAGVFDDHGAATIEDCSFRHSYTVGGGGGVYLWESTTLLRRCDFIDNTGFGDGGGAVYALGGGPVFTDCRFNGNNGAVLCIGQGLCTLINCTIANNGIGLEEFETWPTIFATQDGTLELKNCIVFGNTPVIEPGVKGIVLTMLDGSVTADNCCIALFDGSIPGVGTIAADPLYLDIDGADDIAGNEDDDLRLASASPCIDGGADRNVLPGSLVDLDGLDRMTDGDGDGVSIVDMGCYELPMGAIPGDLDGDGLVNGSDLGLLLAGWGACNDPCSADLNADSTVDGADLGILLGNWR